MIYPILPFLTAYCVPKFDRHDGEDKKNSGLQALWIPPLKILPYIFLKHRMMIAPDIDKNHIICNGHICTIPEP